jgi:Lrp/AsnC family leucine-responsive transcriptional regulator
MLDRIDRKILNLLQKNNQLTTEELSAAVGISQPTCYRRLRRLREKKVITGEAALIDPKAAGSYLTIIVEVELERERLDLFNEFKKSMLQAPEVTQCYVVTGEADFILIVIVPDLETYNQFVEERFYGNRNVRKFRSVITLQRAKFEVGFSLSEN